MTKSERFESVWDALEETPEEAAKMKACADLMTQITNIAEENKWGNVQAAEQFHTSPARMNELFEGRIDLFELDELVRMAGALGRKLRIEIEAA